MGTYGDMAQAQSKAVITVQLFCLRCGRNFASFCPNLGLASYIIPEAEEHEALPKSPKSREGEAIKRLSVLTSNPNSTTYSPVALGNFCASSLKWG